MHVDLALLKQLLVSSPAVVGLSREQVPPRAWPGIVFVPAANSDPPLWGDAECPFQCLFSPQPSCEGLRSYASLKTVMLWCCRLWAFWSSTEYKFTSWLWRWFTRAFSGRAAWHLLCQGNCVSVVGACQEKPVAALLTIILSSSSSCCAAPMANLLLWEDFLLSKGAFIKSPGVFSPSHGAAASPGAAACTLTCVSVCSALL